MKLLTSVFALMICGSVFAQEQVYLESKKVVVNDSQAILVRTNKTPKRVKVVFNQVPMSESVCQAYDTRYVVQTNGSYCGYSRDVVYGRETYCTARNRRGNCTNYASRRTTRYVSYPRSCPVPETYCSQYGTNTSYTDDGVVLKFKNLPALGDSEQDSFLVSAKQKNYDGTNVVYQVKALETVQPYEVKDIGFLGIDKFSIRVK